MLENIQSMSLLAFMEILGPLLLAAALIYGLSQWARRRRGTQAVSEEATRWLYQEGTKEKEVELDMGRPQERRSETR